MKRNLQNVILLIFIAFSASAQLNVKDGDVLEGYGTTEDAKVTLEFTIEAGVEDVGLFLWEAVMSDDMPEDWQFTICDTELCYAPGVLMASDSKPNTILPGSSFKYKFELSHSYIVGEGTLQVRFFSADDPSVTLLTSDLLFDVDMVSSTEGIFSDTNFNLYPNPTADFFQIENDNDVASVAVYSIVGKEMFSYNHTVGQAYSVNDLSNGYYMARLIGADGQTIKIIRFNKK